MRRRQQSVGLSVSVAQALGAPASGLGEGPYSAKEGRWGAGGVYMYM
jgi:hypothetical protein